MCALQGIEPKVSEIPIDIEDFPQIVRDSLDIFNRLGDKYVSTELGPLYTGKDLSTLPILYDYADVTLPREKRLVLEIVQHLDSKAVAKEIKKFKQASDKIKAKNRAKRK